MAGLTVTRENLYYIAGGKQSTWGTAVAPTWSWRWRDGTEANPEVKISIEREGDTSPFNNLAFKTGQYWHIKIVEYVRPMMAGYALQSLLGTGSDTYTAPTQSTTLSASITAGAASFNTTASIGNAGTGYFNFTPGYANASYEVQNVNLAGRTGAGPYTYPLVGSGTFLNAHSNGDTVNNASSHVFTRQQTTYDPYTIEFAFSQAGFGKAFRIQDCVCTELKIVFDSGKPVAFEHSWYGSLATQQAALYTPTFEGTSVIGLAGSPFMFYQVAANTWKIDGSAANNATSIFKGDMTLKNTTGAEDLKNEFLYPTYFIPGNMDISGNLSVHFQNYAQYLETYYGSASAGTGSQDSYLVGTGQFSTTFNTDGINSLALSLPYINYTAAKLSPKLDGKPLTQSLVFSATKNATNLIPLTITLLNSLASVY